MSSLTTYPIMANQSTSATWKNDNEEAPALSQDELQLVNIFKPGLGRHCGVSFQVETWIAGVPDCDTYFPRLPVVVAGVWFKWDCWKRDREWYNITPPGAKQGLCLLRQAPRVISTHFLHLLEEFQQEVLISSIFILGFSNILVLNRYRSSVGLLIILILIPCSSNCTAAGTSLKALQLVSSLWTSLGVSGMFSICAQWTMSHHVAKIDLSSF